MNAILQKKIEEAINEEFVGNYIFSEDEKTEMLDEVSRNFRYVCDMWGENISPLLYNAAFVTLINLTKDWESANDKWLDFLFKKLLGKQSVENEPTGKAYKQIELIYDSLTRKEKIFSFSSFQKKYYATITSHALSPKSSLLAFFDMCWEIYCEDLNQEYIKDDSAFELVAKSLKNKLIGNTKDDEDLKIGSRVYALRASIKGLILDRPNEFISLLNQTICFINSLFNDEPLKKDKYLQLLVDEWWKEKEETFGIEKTKTKYGGERVSSDYSQIKAKYLYEDDSVVIHISPFRLLSNFDYEPYLYIKSQGEIVFSSSIETMGSGILMSTCSFNINIDKLNLKDLSNISVEITLCEEEIFNSKLALCRDFLLFNDRRELSTQDCLPGVYYLFVPDFKQLARFPQDLQKINSKIYSVNALEGEVLQSKNKTVFFLTEKTNRELYFFARERGDIIFRQCGEEYEVIDGDVYVDVESKVDIKNYGVRYEDVSFKLSEFDTENLGDRIRINVSSLLDVGQPQQLNIFKYSDNTVVSAINLVKFHNINVEFDRRYYFADFLSGSVRFKTEKYDNKVYFNALDSEISIPIERGEIIVRPPIITWSIDSGKNNFKPKDNPVWYKKHNNSSVLKLQFPKDLQITVGLGGETIAQCGNTHDEYEFGRLLFSKAENADVCEFPLLLRINEDLYVLETIVTKEKFIGKPITVNSETKKVYWNPKYFVGDDKTQFKINFYNKGEIVYSSLCDSKSSKTFRTTFSDGYYFIELISISNGLIQKETQIEKNKYAFGNEKEFQYKGKIIEIKSVYFYGINKPERCRTLYIDSLKYLGEKYGSDFYSGRLFFINRNNGLRTPVSYLSDGKGNSIKINPLRLEITSRNHCNIGYGLDINDEAYEYDDEFALDSEGKITVALTTNGIKNKPIFYYIMEIKDNV